jgi:hypothetical protein
VQVPATELPTDAAEIEFRSTDIASGQATSVRDHFIPAGR